MAVRRLAIALNLFAAALAAAGLAAVHPASAQDEAPPSSAARDTASSEADLAAARAARQAELDALSREITLTETHQAELRAEIEALSNDRATLNETLITTGERAQLLEGDLDQTELRLGALLGEEDRLQASLRARRGVLVEVLAALQRMGREPPPAILIRPEDALASVRSAILLGAVVPDLKIQAEAVAMDLRELVALRDEMARERDRLAQDSVRLAEERARIELLIGEKRSLQAQSEDALAGQRERAADLAGKARTLKELIDGMEQQIAAAAQAAEEARKADAALAAAVTGPARGPVEPGTLGSTGRIAPAIAFADAKGLLPQPVNGSRLLDFGSDDGFGGQAQGVSFTTRSGARVANPADGWVVYAGPFRTYGQLLIINAGGGYHVLLAGMDRIDVELGQFVLAGEPVAVMGDRRLASAGTVDAAARQPVLYVEFRKDGTSIDPGPWWAQANEKVGG